MAEQELEYIVHGLEQIALIIRREYDEPGIHFFTPPSFSQQVAHMKHPAGHKVEAHVHNFLIRQVVYTQEVLFVKKGKVKIKLYNSDRVFLTEKVLTSGDLILLCGGGHSIKMMEETSMIEVKQGPYAGENDKTRFEETPACR